MTEPMKWSAMIFVFALFVSLMASCNALSMRMHTERMKCMDLRGKWNFGRDSCEELGKGADKLSNSEIQKFPFHW
jgi:hypothetical protein